MKRIGIIGGMSWSATAAYYQRLNTLVHAALGANHSADLIVRSLDFQTLIEQLEQPQQIEAAIHCAAVDVTHAGAQLIALASLTGHCFATGLSTLPVPFLGIDASVRDALDATSLKSVGVLATSLAMRDSLLMSRLVDTTKRRLVPPRAAFDQVLDRLIFDELAHARLSDDGRGLLQTIAADMVRDGAEAILLGTTEFSFLGDRMSPGVPVLDAAEIHCRDLVKRALREPERTVTQNATR